MFSGWDFRNPVQIVFGRGSLRRLPELLSGQGGLLVVSTAGFRNRGGLERLLPLFGDRRPVILDDVDANPDLAQLESQLSQLQQHDIHDIVAVGGGSVLDTAKVIAIGLSGEAFSLRQHLIDGTVLPDRRPNHLVCIPTTAGTGSEVTPFATVWNMAAERKYSLSGGVVFPDVALLDPELTYSVPRDVTIATGLDAITQAFEATWSKQANPISSALAVRAIRLALVALPKLVVRLEDGDARCEMLEASMLAGLAISRSRTALCHSISYPITAKHGVPHGLACGFTLPEVYAFNREAAPERFEELASVLGYASSESLASRLLQLMAELDVAELLCKYVASEEDLVALAPAMLTPGRSDNNLREADVDDVVALVRAAFVSRLEGRAKSASQ